MRTLLLLRHAKSSWDDPMQSDHARPLNRRGTWAAGLIAERFAALPQDARPDLVLCSSARRTVDTVAPLREVLGAAVPVVVEDALYGASAETMLHRLRVVNSGYSSVLVVAHNPGTEELASTLAGDGDPAALSLLRTKYPTGALATLDLEGEWTDLAPGGAHLTDFWRPPRR